MTYASRAVALVFGPPLRAIADWLAPGERVLLLTVGRQRRGVLEGRSRERTTWSRPGLRAFALTDRRLLGARRNGVRLELPLSAVRAARARRGALGSGVLELGLPQGALVVEGLPGADAETLAAALAQGSPGDSPTDLGSPTALHLHRGSLAGLAPVLLADLATLLLAPAALVIWFAALQGVRIGEVGDVGLVGALPLSAIVALLALTAGFALALARDRLGVAVVYVVVLVVALYGALVPIEEVSSFNVTWRHTGIAQYLAQVGTVDPDIDAYFNWPGFFAALALATKAAGVRDALAFAAWWPVAMNLLYLPPLAMIARSVGGDARLVPLTLWIFVLSNWVGQDYLSPQALHFGLFLVVLAVVLTWFGGSERGARPRVARRLRAAIASEPGAVARLPRGGRAAVLLVALAAALAIVPSHQLTPFSLLLVLVALVALRRTWLRGLPLILAVAIFAWLVFAAVSYLSGNIDELRAQFGQLEQTLASNVGERVGGSAGHALVVRARLLAAGLLWIAALAGAAHRLRSGRRTWSLVVLAAAPFGLPLVQPYGGEIVLRVYLFALPAMAALVASLALAAAGTRPLRSGSVVFALTLALLGSFLVTRYGNARIWLFSREEASVVDRVYDVAAPGSILVAPSTALPWQHRRYAELKHRNLSQLEAPPGGFGERALARAVLQVVDDKGEGADGYVITTRSTRAYDALFGRARWGSVVRLERALDASPSFLPIITRRDGRVWMAAPDRGRG